MVEDGGYSFALPAGYDIQRDDNATFVSEPNTSFVAALMLLPRRPGQTLPQLLEQLVVIMNNGGADMTMENFQPRTVGGIEGQIADISGYMADDLVLVRGQAAAVLLSDSWALVSYSFSYQAAWRNQNMKKFAALLDTVEFQGPPPPPAAAAPPVESDVPLPAPGDPPAAEWNGLPIMPQAIAADTLTGENSDGYLYSVAATPAEVQDFYVTQLPQRGWLFLGTGDGPSGATLMIFQKDGQTLSVAIFTLEDGTVYVMLVM